MIKLPKVGFIRMKQHRQVPEEYKLKSVTVSRDISGRYYASVLFEYEPPQEHETAENIIGLAYCENGLYIDSGGKEVCYPSYIRKTAEKLRQEKRRLSHMKKLSQNRRKQRIRVMKIERKLCSQREDFVHKQSRQIANAYDCVCIKDPAQGVSYDFGWTIFKFLLKYKLSDAGKKLIIADEILLSKMLYSFQAV